MTATELALQEEISILSADKATCLAEIEFLTNELKRLQKRMSELELALHDHIQLSRDA